MTAPHDTLVSAEDGRFEEVLAAYLEATDAGWAPSRRAFLERYPAWRDRLQAFFDAGDEVSELVRPLRGRSPEVPTNEPTVILEGKAGSETLPRLFGEYELVQMLGRGGMGIVYKAKHRGREVAVKMILPALIGSGEETLRFRNEADSTARMDHRHIVPIHEVGECDNRPFFSMKLLGSSLADRADDYRDRFAEAADLVEKISRAVHHAHERGILHRDLKPGNILLDEEGEPVVTDFGLARRIEQDTVLTLPGAILGTPSYMAPEQAMGRVKGLTTAVDVYALGAVLYELLTGLPPFKAENALETLLQVREQKPIPPRVRNPRAPRDLESICLKCLEKDPAKRYPTALALADDLKHWREGDLIEARPAGPMERFWKWTRRRPALAAASFTGLALLVLGLVSLGALSQLREVREARDQSASMADAELEARQAAEAQRAEAQSSRQRAVSEKARAEKALSVNGLVRAHLAFRDNEFDQARRALDATPEAPRGWEWRLVNALVRPPARAFPAHRGRVPAVACSSVGGLMASGDVAGNLILWDVKTGKALHTLPNLGDVTSVAFSPDGKTLACGGDSEVRLWDTASGEPAGRREGHKSKVSAVGYSPDGEHLASAGADGTVKVFDKAGKLLHSLGGHQKGVTSLAFSPDGKRLVTGDEEGTVRVWEVASGKQRDKLELEGACRGLAYSPDGRWIAANKERFRVYLFDADTARLAHEINEPGDLVNAIAFSPEGDLATASARREVRLWNPATGEPVRTVVPPVGSPSALAYSPAGWLCVATDSGSVHLVDTQAGSRRVKLRHGESKLRGAVLSPDGKRGATAGAKPRLWDLETGRPAKPLEGYEGAVTSAAFSADGTRLAAGCADHKVRVWEVGTGGLRLTLNAPAAGVRAVTFSPSGTHLAALCADATVRVWEAKTGREERRLAATLLSFDLAFSPDGKLLAAGESNAVQVWDVAGGEERFVLRGHARVVGPIRFSPDGRWLASGSFDGSIRLWDAATGRLVKELVGHKDAVAALAFDASGRLASSSKDETVRLWDVELGTEVLTLKDSGGVVDSLTFADNRLLGGVAGRGWVQVWEVPAK